METPTFTGHENHDFPLDTAAAWTKNYRNANLGATKGHFFGKDAIDAILGQANCVGIRIYYALDENAKKHLIVVGVQPDGNDLVNGLLAERSIDCPPTCGISNALNSDI
jgi:hypothetical protein